MINPWLDSAVLGIHILAAISWVGGMIFVAFIVGTYVRRHFSPAERTPLMADIGKRFSYLGWSAILVLVVTGIYNAIRFLGSWDALWQTTFGHILLAKSGLVGVMILLSIVHDFFLVLIPSSGSSCDDPRAAPALGDDTSEGQRSQWILHLGHASATWAGCCARANQSQCPPLSPHRLLAPAGQRPPRRQRQRRLLLRQRCQRAPLSSARCIGCAAGPS